MMFLQRLSILLFGSAALLGVAAGQTPAAAPPTAPDTGVEAGAAVAEPAAPAPAEVSAQVLALRRDLDALIRGPNWPSAQWGVMVVSLDRGDTLYAHNADLPLAPASNMKLFSTAAALYYLGPDFRYSTYVLTDGEIRDGVLEGDVVLYGTGDPAMSSRMLGGALPPLRALADSLLSHGVTEVRGDVIGDGSYFDDAWFGEGWREEYRLASYSAPVGALSLAENILSVRVLPGAAAGQPAEIRTVPTTQGLQVENRVRTIASGASSVRFSHGEAGLVLEGQIARGHPGVARTVTVVDPANFAAAVFRNVLENAGIRVHGGVRSVHHPAASPVGRSAAHASMNGGSDPPPRVIAAHLSPTMAELAGVTNHISQNLFAEALLKTVGRVALGDGSFTGGSRAVHYFLECERPFDAAGIRIVDGSGLSPLNRITPRSTIHLLDLMTRTDEWEAFYTSLPEAASPQGGLHSLRNRMGQTPAARNLRAKTGTISNVSSLSGYVRAANGEMLAFSIYVNDTPSTFQAKRIEDAIGVRLAGFTRPAEAPPSPIAEPEPTTAPEPVEADTAAPDAPGAAGATDAAAAAPDAAPPAPATRTHRVSSGETLDGIARRYGTSVAEIQRLNPGVNPRRLQIGQSITVPD